MLRAASGAHVALLVLADTLATAAAWWLAYGLRLQGFPTRLTKGVPPTDAYALAMLAALAATWLAFRAANLYRPRPEGGFVRGGGRIVRASLLALTLLLAAMFFFSRFEYSRAVIVNYALLHPVAVIVARGLAARAAAALRGRGLATRRACIVGAGRTGQDLLDALRRRPALGVEVVGFLDDRPSRQGRSPRGVPVLGAVATLPAVVAAQRLSDVFLALPPGDWGRMAQLEVDLGDTSVDVHLVPDLNTLDTLRATAAELDGLAIVSMRDTPLSSGWNRALKRAEDIVVAGTALLLLALPMLILAALVKLTSRGPVFYGQERMGLDGRTFRMLKFRSMRTDAEVQTGAVWAVKDDPRRTRLGTLMRKTSLDELPQLWHVLRGEMSIVGPRPERPVFIEQFRKTIPRYMLRHKVKAGITGFAQVNGWRGDTSLRKRIQYDLDYIRHWSLWLDLKIMVLTIVKGLVGPNAY